MGYREDIDANFTIDRSQLGADAVKTIANKSSLGKDDKAVLLKVGDVLSVLEDFLTQKAITANLRKKQNIFQTRYRATYEAYQKAYPDTQQPNITLDELEKLDPGIKEQARQVMSYEQGTVSGIARDCISKIEQALEGIIGI